MRSIKTKIVQTTAVVACLFVSVSASDLEEFKHKVGDRLVAMIPVNSAEVKKPRVTATPKVSESHRVLIYFFHQTQRSHYSREMEARLQEAIERAFAPEVKDSIVVWLTVNTDSDSTEHYSDDYRFSGEAIILSLQRSHKELRCSRLDRAPEYLKDQKSLQSYIRNEVWTLLTGE